MTTSHARTARLPAVWQRTVGYAEKAVASPFVAYAAIAALQLRILWNIWKYSDLVSGDTSSYFLDVATWEHGLKQNVVYSPLYDAFWGTILDVVHNLSAAIVQRVAIILGVALLVLALMRSLFPPALALLMGVGGNRCPANYDPLYEVHLAGAIPILLALLVVARMPRRQGMGIAVAILLAGAVCCAPS